MADFRLGFLTSSSKVAASDVFVPPVVDFMMEPDYRPGHWTRVPPTDFDSTRDRMTNMWNEED